MLSPESMLQERYLITVIADSRPDSSLYRAIDQRDSLRVLIAALPQPNSAALAEVQQVAEQISRLDLVGLLKLRATFADGLTLYMVADDPGGPDFERAIRERGGPLSEVEAMRHMTRLLTILDSVHSQRPPLVLGDLRPTDLWASPEGDLSLTPFVLVRPIGQEPSPYRAPELASEGVEPNTSSDIYALGAVQYQLTTGWAPPTAVARASGTPLNAPRMLNGGISALAEQMILRALEMKPGNRYQQAREMRSAVETVRLMGGKPLGALSATEFLPDQPPGTTSAASPPPPQLGGAALPPAQQPLPLPSPPAAPSQPAAPPQETYRQIMPDAPPVAQRRNWIDGVPNGCLIGAISVLGVVALLVCILGVVIVFLLINGGGGAGVTSVFTEMTAVPATPPTPLPSTSSSSAPSAATLSFTETNRLEEDPVGSALFSPDGRYLAVAIGSEIRLYDAVSFELEETLSGHTADVNALAFSPAGSSPLLIASGSTAENEIRLWNAATGEEVAQLSGHTGWIRGLTFSPDGRLLASSSIDQTARIWDVASRNNLLILEGHTDWLGNLSFSPDGTQLATAARDGTVRLWQVEGGGVVADFAYTAPLDPNTGEPFWLTGISFSPDGETIAVGSTSGSLYLLESATGRQLRELSGHADWVIIRGVSFSPDGRTVATASLDGTVRLWNPSSGAERAVLNRQGLRLLSAAWDEGGERLVTSSDTAGQVVIWDVTSREVARSLDLAQGAVTALAYTRDGSVLASGGAGGTVRLHLLAEGEDLTIPGGAPTSQYLAFRADTELLAVSNAGELVMIDLTQASEAIRLEGLGDLTLSVAVSPDGRLIAAGNRAGQVGLWDAATLEFQRTLRGLNGPVYGLAFSADGGRLAATVGGDNPAIGLFDTAAGRLEETIRSETGSFTGVAFAPDGSHVVGVTIGGALTIYSPDGTAERTWNAEENQAWYSSLAYAPQGGLIATGSMDGRVELWNPATGERLSDIQLNGGSILAVAFRADGREIAAATRDGGIIILGTS